MAALAVRQRVAAQLESAAERRELRAKAANVAGDTSLAGLAGEGRDSLCRRAEQSQAEQAQRCQNETSPESRTSALECGWLKGRAETCGGFHDGGSFFGSRELFPGTILSLSARSPLIRIKEARVSMHGEVCSCVACATLEKAAAAVPKHPVAPVG